MKLAEPNTDIILSPGNFNRSDAAAFLKGFTDVLGPNDKMLIGVDACNDPARV